MFLVVFNLICYAAVMFKQKIRIKLLELIRKVELDESIRYWIVRNMQLIVDMSVMKCQGNKQDQFPSENKTKQMCTALSCVRVEVAVLSCPS